LVVAEWVEPLGGRNLLKNSKKARCFFMFFHFFCEPLIK